MSVETTGGSNLEGVLFRLMDYQSREDTDKVDTMIMASLVNLLGIVSVMNKMSLVGAPVSRNRSEDPVIMTLLQMLAQGQGQHPGAPGGAPGINPALLLSLLGSRGQRPENALLLSLLSSMMQPPPGPPHQPENQRQETQTRPAGNERTPESAPRETRKIGGHLSWDRRLG
ncbi:MAG: hypothetical protein ACOY30_01140 [Bacillota bacterium]